MCRAQDPVDRAGEISAPVKFAPVARYALLTRGYNAEGGAPRREGSVSTLRSLLILIVLATFAACAGKLDHCWVCQREIHPQVRATVTLGNGKNVSACCPRCALHYGQESPDPVQAIRVTDYAGAGSLPMKQAFLVEGSDEAPCMHHPPVTDPAGAPMQVCYDRCMPSLIAFRTEAAARTFAAEHGGTLYAPGSFPGLPRAER